LTGNYEGKEEYVQHTNVASRRKKPKEPRTGATIGESMMNNKPAKGRQKSKLKEKGFPRL